MSDRESPDTSTESATASAESAAPTAAEPGAPAATEPAASRAEPYRVLARKYRPSSFDDLIGQEAMVRTLENAFATGRIAQAFMLTGVRGVGKTTTARILARALNYETDTISEPTIRFGDGEGVHDRAIMEGRHPDVIEMDAASHTGVDNMRDVLASLQYAPISARLKVYIIDEVHMLSSGAFNAMLKTLEEPPAHVKFIFATTEIRKVPVTILSRCQRFDLRRVEAAVLMDHLRGIAEKEGVAIGDEALAAIARASEGSVRDALSLLDQAIVLSLGEGAGVAIDAATVRDMLGLADRARVIDLFDAVMRGDMKGALEEFGRQYGAGALPGAILSELASHVHLVSRLKFVPEAAGDATLSEEERRRGAEAAKGLSTGVLSRAWQILLRGMDEVNTAAEGASAAEMVLIRLAHAATLPGPEEAIRALRGGGSVGGAAIPNGAGPSPDGGATVASGTPPGGAGGGATASGGARILSFSRGGALRAPDDDALDLAEPEAEVAATEPAPARVEARAHLSVVPDAPASPEPDGVVGDDPFDDPARVLSILAELAAERRDLPLRRALRQQTRLGALEREGDARVLSVHVAGADRGFGVDTARKLSEWTGTRWIVRMLDTAPPNARTLYEDEEAARAARLRDAESDPNVAAILAAFPGSRITRVGPPGEGEVPDEPDVPAIPVADPFDRDEAPQDVPYDPDMDERDD